jgi:serine O-acetyltransferase
VTRTVRLIVADLRAKAEWNYERSDGKSLLKALLTDGTPAMVWYRLQQAARRWRLAPLEMVFNRINTVFCDCTIGRGAEFGPGFVLIGAEKRQSPVLGDGVIIGAGAKIIGGIRLGDGAKIGANAVVLTDIPDHATAVGIPAKVVRVGSNNSSPG